MRVVTGQRFLFGLSVLREGAAIALANLRRVCIRVLILLNLLFFLFALCLTIVLLVSILIEAKRYGCCIGALWLNFKYWRFSWR